MTEDTSVDGSLGSYEIVDVVKEDQIQLSESHRQSPSEPRRYSPSQSHHPSVKPTECSSGVSFVDGPKVEELAENLMLATQENERYRMAMEDCNRVLSKEVEAAETRRQETEHLKNQLVSYKETNKGLEDRIRDLESQLLNTVCVCVCFKRYDTADVASLPVRDVVFMNTYFPWLLKCLILLTVFTIKIFTKPDIFYIAYVVA